MKHKNFGKKRKQSVVEVSGSDDVRLVLNVHTCNNVTSRTPTKYATRNGQQPDDVFFASPKPIAPHHFINHQSPCAKRQAPTAKRNRKQKGEREKSEKPSHSNYQPRSKRMIRKPFATSLVLMLRCLASGVHSFRPLTPIRLLSSSLSVGAEKKGLRNRRKERKENQPALGSLEWETFDFSESPKWDGRFGDDGDIHVASYHDNWEGLVEEEAKQDVALQKEFERRHQIWNNLDDKLIEDATNVLLPFIQEQRWERIQSIMQQRTQQAKFLYENPANPSNVFACLRTLESFGIQHVDVVIQSGKYEGKAALSQKRGMRTAMGSAKWLTMRNHLNTEFALESIKREDYHIICTDVNPSSKDVRDVDWDASGKKICVVMGNEQRGISDAVKDMADESFYLPMCGMAESFNLSVATAITCAHMSAASKDGDGPLRPGDLSEKEYKTVLLKGALNSMKPRLARALFKKHGLVLPNELNVS